MSKNKNRIQINLPTLIAISIVAWALVDILHEIIGHAGAAFIMGIPVKAVSTSTAYIIVNWDQFIGEHGLNPIRLFTLGGTIVNIVTGALALLALKWKKAMSSTLCYFLWLFASFSMIIVAMNMVTNTLLGFGDWAVFISTLEQENVWKIIIIVVGLLLTVTGYILSLRQWVPNMKGHRLTLLKITAIPVVTVIAVQTLSLIKSPFAALPPESNHILASFFAYIHFILWVIVVNLIPGPRSIDNLEAIRLPPSNFWLVLGLIVFIVFILVLGPGIGSFVGDPRLR
ncbi:MAG: hypothetical protein MUO40_03890 [Anaerolineaceae bacterium]|nr:hypothetical protein [Anaerolineaceae bacterium]